MFGKQSTRIRVSLMDKLQPNRESILLEIQANIMRFSTFDDSISLKYDVTTGYQMKQCLLAIYENREDKIYELFFIVMMTE